MKTITVEAVQVSKEDLQFSLPASKSIANRMFVLSALTPGTFRLDGDFAAEDIQLMIQSLQSLGISIQQDDAGCVVSHDLSWMYNADALELFLGNSGTCMRFLSSLVALRAGTTVLTGKQRMMERPIADLVSALREFNVPVEYLKREGFPPLRISGQGSVSGGDLEISGQVSSQFISSLLLSAPAFAGGLTLQLQGKVISRPYILLTLDVLAQWGVKALWSDDVISVPCCQLISADRSVEGDASAAVYWWAFGFLHDCEVRFDNLSQESHQGDVQFVDLLDRIRKHSQNEQGQLTVDMNTMPDASLMLMAMAPSFSFPTKITGIGSLRVKETDRIFAMQKELQKLGVDVETGENWMLVHPCDFSGRDYKTVQISTYDDHRIAMSFAILGSLIGPFMIEDPDCVQKSYPQFWQDFEFIKKSLA